MGLPYYAVERDTMTAQGAAREPRLCPVCTKPGRWVGATFLPDQQRAQGYPPCYCRTIHQAGPGAYAYDPETKGILRRA